MLLSNDQYLALNSLLKWHRKYSHQIIEIAGVVGTGIKMVINEFLEMTQFDRREIMHLSLDQKQALEMAHAGNHAYYLDNVLYKYCCITDQSTLKVINEHSQGVVSTWKREKRKSIDERYKLMIVYDSMLLNEQALSDLCEFGLPIILLRDPMLLPPTDSYVFKRNPNVFLRELNPELAKRPIVHFTHHIVNGRKPSYGSYDEVNIIPQKQMSLYNIKSSEMNIALSRDVADVINQMFREKVIGLTTTANVVGERLLVLESMYREVLKNDTNKKVKVFLRKGSVGFLTKINKHALTTRFVPCNFRLDGYNDSFEELMIDRYRLNRLSYRASRQEVPEESLQVDFAYALTPTGARLSHWDKTTVILCDSDYDDEELNARMTYTALTRGKKSLTIVM